MAQSAVDRGDSSSAFSMLQEAEILATSPEEKFQAIFTQAGFLDTSGQAMDSLALYEKCLEMSPADASVLLNMG